MNGCCDVCDKSDYLISIPLPNGYALYLCSKCAYDLRTEGDDDTNDGTLEDE